MRRRVAECRMQINRTMAVLIALVVLLVGAVAFLLGQRSSPDSEPEPAPTDSAIISSQDPYAVETPEAEATAPPPLAVRIGRDGPHASACERIGRVANLPRGADDFLAVREAPSADATMIDELGDDAPFYLCDRQGGWFGIVYLSDGTLPADDRCGLENSVGSPRAYSGDCLTGWVASRYVDASGAQDSDEPYEGEDDAPQSRTVQVSATGPTQVVASMRMSLKAETDYGKPVSQRPDGNRVSCRETGTGDAAWTCTATYTITNQPQ
ncbi:hypothetical protein AAG604_09485 [Citromicrobium bathyomarinum]